MAVTIEAMTGRLLGTKLFGVCKCLRLNAVIRNRSPTGRLMFKKIKNFNFSSVVSMGIGSSAFKVVEKSPIYYSEARILDNNDRGHETFRLYYVEQSGSYEAVLYNPDESPVCFSVFRLEEENKAKEMFR